MPKLPFAALFLLSVATVGRADALGDLKASLNRLAGRQTVTATFDISRSRHAKGRFLTEDFDGSASFVAEMNAAGVRVSFSRGLIDRANDEEWLTEVNPARTDATWQTLQEVVPQSVERALDYSKPLLRLVARGSIVEQRVENLQGRPTRVLVMRLPLQSAAEHDPGAMKVSDDVLTVWIDGNGLPLTTRRVRKGVAGVFLLHVDTVRTESATYAIRGDHLVTTRLEDSAAVDGPGQHGTATTVWLLRDVNVPPAAAE